jgi:hypothetical protein
MPAFTYLVIATFTVPERIGTTPQSLLWLLPLTAAITVVYKTTKLPEMKLVPFIKESAVLFGSIVVFIILTALALYAVSFFIAM